MRKKYGIDILFSLSLFTVFVICAFLILLLQTNGYHSIIAQSEASSNLHTPLAYVQSRIRANDAHGCIDTFSAGGISGMKISDEQQLTNTYIYEQDDELKELRIASQIEPDFTTGSALFKIKTFLVNIQGSVVHLEIEDMQTNSKELNVQLRSE